MVSGSSSTMIFISRSYINHVSRPLRAYLFKCPWANGQCPAYYFSHCEKPPNVSKDTINLIKDFSSFVEDAA